MNRTALLGGLGTLTLLVVLWEAAVWAFRLPAYLVPAPSVIWLEFVSNWYFYLGQTGDTLWAVLVGFVIATALGTVAGCIIAYSVFFRATLYPLILLLQVVPKVAIAPILIIFLGYGLSFKVTVIAAISFFPIVINTVLGLTSVEPDLVMLTRVLRATRLKQLAMVGLPHAALLIFSGMKISMTLAVIGAVVAEFVSSDSGLGYTLLLANTQLKVSMAFVALILLSVLGFVLFYVIEIAERLLIPWTDEDDNALAHVV